MEISGSAILFSSVSSRKPLPVSLMTATRSSCHQRQLFLKNIFSYVICPPTVKRHSQNTRPWTPKTYRSWRTMLQPQWRRTAIRRRKINTVVDIATTEKGRRKRRRRWQQQQHLYLPPSRSSSRRISEGEREEQEGPTPPRSEQYNIGFSSADFSSPGISPFSWWFVEQQYQQARRRRCASLMINSWYSLRIVSLILFQAIQILH